MITDVQKDPTALTMTVTAEFDAPVDRVWQLWADPRKLERWWGPPMFPATFDRHEFTAGGSCTYFMTGPEGERHHGWWKVLAIDPPHGLDVEDGFGDDTGAPNPAMPTMRMSTRLAAAGAGTRVVIVTTFNSVEQMEQLAAMGMEEGMRLAMGQMDALLD